MKTDFDKTKNDTVTADEARIDNIDEKEPVQLNEEELYVETLSKKERKEYEKRKKELRRSQWMSEYWIIIVLAVALLVVVTALVMINQIKEFTSYGMVERIFDDILDAITPIMSF